MGRGLVAGDPRLTVIVAEDQVWAPRTLPGTRRLRHVVAEARLFMLMTGGPMSDADRGQVNVDAAEVYDSLFVPALFGRFAEAVAEAAQI